MKFVIKTAVVCFLVVVSTAVCRAEKVEKDNAIFPILAWWLPSPTDENLQLYKEANFNVWRMSNRKNSKPEAIEKWGLYLLVNADNQYKTKPFSKELCLQNIVWAANRKMIAFMLWDEPNSKDFELIAKKVQVLQRSPGGKTAMTNLYPMYASERQLGERDFETYLTKYLDIVKPSLISYDFYALGKENIHSPDFYLNMEIVRRHCLKRDIVFWAFVQSRNWGNMRRPSESDLRWNVYSDLAYGAKGIWYFTYYGPSKKLQVQKGNSYFGWGDGLVSADTNKPNELYWYAQRLNSEIQALGNTLHKLRSTFVTHLNIETPKEKGTVSWPKQGYGAIKEINGDNLLIGFFEEKEKPGNDEFIMIVNKKHGANLSSVEAASQCEITFDSKVKELVEIDRFSGKEQPIFMPCDKKIKLNLPGGTGRLFRISGTASK